MKMREYLFRGFTPCSNHNCIIKKPEGMGTNGSCACLLNLSRSQLNILSSRISAVADKELDVQHRDKAQSAGGSMKLLEFAGKVFIPAEKITGFCPNAKYGDGWVFIATGADGADGGDNGFYVEQDIEEVADIIRKA